MSSGVGVGSGSSSLGFHASASSRIRVFAGPQISIGRSKSSSETSKCSSGEGHFTCCMANVLLKAEFVLFYYLFGFWRSSCHNHESLKLSFFYERIFWLFNALSNMLCPNMDSVTLCSKLDIVLHYSNLSLIECFIQFLYAYNQG